MTLTAAAHREGHRTGQGNRKLYWQGWVPEAPDPHAVIVISHGASEHGGRYGHVVDRLVPQGYAVYAQDHRGHGRSEGTRALVDRLDNAVADLDGFVDHVRSQHPGLPVILLAHSMGGCIGICYAARHQDKLAALILSSPVAALEAASPTTRAAARIFSAITPRLGVYRVEAEAISRDPHEVRAYQSDPLVDRGKLPVRTVNELARAVRTFPDTAAVLSLPLLAIHGTADRIVPIAGTEMVVERASSQDKTLLRYEGHFHELFNEPEAERNRVLDDVSGWLNERFPRT